MPSRTRRAGPSARAGAHTRTRRRSHAAAAGWARNAEGTDTATAGRWERANPEKTTYQANGVTSGSRALVTGYRAGAGPSSYDVDGGGSSIRSPAVVIEPVS